MGFIIFVKWLPVGFTLNKCISFNVKVNKVNTQVYIC